MTTTRGRNVSFFKNPFKRKPAAPPRADDHAARPSPFLGRVKALLPKKPEAPFNLEDMKRKLEQMLEARNENRALNAVVILTGAGVAAAGIAADMMFLGGVGTVTVISCLYSDLRSAQQIRKISEEIGKLDDKIDGLRPAPGAAADYAPALKAVNRTIEDFKAAAEKLPPDVAEELDRLQKQVTALQAKITPPPAP